MNMGNLMNTGSSSHDMGMMTTVTSVGGSAVGSVSCRTAVENVEVPCGSYVTLTLEPEDACRVSDFHPMASSMSMTTLSMNEFDTLSLSEFDRSALSNSVQVGFVCCPFLCLLCVICELLSLRLVLFVVPPFN
jgi:hypothetical protein